MRERYYVKTGYHYWQIMRRDDLNMPADVVPEGWRDDAVDSISARRHGGDAGAREVARRRCDDLNRALKSAALRAD